jgi:hypothetical protein
MSETLIIVADNERERDRGLIELAKSAVETNTRLIVAAGDDRLDRLGLTGVLPWGFECERELLEPEFPPTQELATALKRHRASLVAVVPPLRHPGEFLRLLGICKAASAAVVVALRAEHSDLGAHLFDKRYELLPSKDLRLSEWRKPGEGYTKARERRAADRRAAGSVTW